MKRVQVVVAGAGPAGLTAAIALARAGIETLLLERRERPSRVPRATAISTATMELMRSWGLEAPLRAGELDVDLLPWVSETLAATQGRAIDAGFPSREQSALVSPAGPAGLPQSHLEPVLEAHLRTLGAARVERGAEVVAVEQDPAGVTLLVRSRERPGERRIRARYLIAADGIRSTVRAVLGIPITGRDDLGERLVALFRAPLWDLVGARRHTIYVITGAGRPCFFVPAALPDHWVFGADIDPEHERIETIPVAKLIRRAAGAELEPRIEHVGAVPYGVHVADRFRDGRVFLAGDAAHRVTPRGGTGLNGAVRSGFDIGWKLAWVLRGWAGERLLDSYERERRPLVEHNAARSADPEGSWAEAARELWTDLGGRIPHRWLGPRGARVSTLDLIGDGLTLFTGERGSAWAAAAASAPLRVPLAVRRLDGLTARSLGIGEEGALLARPDGRPVALWPTAEDPAASLRSAAGSLAAGAADVPTETVAA